MGLKNRNKSFPEVISFIKQKDYKNLKWLGEGSFGLTLLLEDETINEKFVCKKYSPLLGVDKEKYYKNFLNEIKLMYKINHNNIVRVFSYYMYEKYYTGYVLMEYIDGVSINKFLNEHPEFVDDIFEQVIEGFSYLESKKILHRDIRSSNILVDYMGYVKIIDFGFGKQTINSKDFDRSFSSLNWWCPLPDDFQHQIYDFKTEIYFIGKLFEKLINDNEITSFNYYQLLAKMCEVNPNKRISSFELIKRNIQKNDDLDDLFSPEEIDTYQTFVDNLDNTIIGVYKDIKYYDDIDIIQKNLSDLCMKVMLEMYVPQNTLILNCFFNGSYRYNSYKIETSVLKNFMRFFKSCTKDKKNIVINNLHTRFDSITRLNDDLLTDEEVPF